MKTQPTTETPETPEPVNETAQVSAADIVAPLGERMPPVTESADNNAPGEPEQSPVSSPEMRDAKGMKFDPFRHQTLPDGTPRKNAKGNFMIRNDYRLGLRRRNGEPAPVNAGTPTFADTTTQPAGPVEDQFDAAADVYIHAAFGPLQITFGEAIKPDREEHAALKAAVANYLRATNATELSPGWALTITLAAFAAKKASVPTIQERALTIWEKIRAMFGRKPKQIAQ
jgi:hypothetical protein